MGKNKSVEWINGIGKRMANFRPPFLLSCLGGIIFSAVSIILVAAEWGRIIPPAITYIIDVFAAVFLAMAVWSIILLVRRTSPARAVSGAAHKNRVLGRLWDDHTYRTMTFGYISLAVNSLLALSKVVMGWWFSSKWFMALAGYYLVLCLTKTLVLCNSRMAAAQADEQRRNCKEWKAYRLCGWLLLVLTLTLQGVAIMIVKDGTGFFYRGYLIFVVALYDFYCLIAGVVYIVKNRRKHLPSVMSIKYINFATSLVAILSLQTAMFASFGADTDLRTQQFMNMMTGTAVCIILGALGILMIFQSNRRLRKSDG